MKSSKSLFAMGLSVLPLFAVALSAPKPFGDPPSPRLLWSFRPGEIRGSYSNPILGPFDLSPDGSTLAIEFTAEGGPDALGVWVAEWDIAARRIVMQRRVQGPTTIKENGPAQQGLSDLRFTPDGSKVVAQTGRELTVLNGSNLAPVYTVPLLGGMSRAPRSVISRFAISGDGKWLAVLSTVPKWGDCAPSDVRLFHLETGKSAAAWELPQACAGSIALSPDGTQLLLSHFSVGWPRDVDILLLDSHTGTVVRRISSGFRGPNGGAWDAQFVALGRFVAVPASWNTRPGDSGKALKIFDSRTGDVVQELTYGRFGSHGTIATSWNAPVVATINYWLGLLENMLSDDIHPKRGADLLLYRLDESQPYCALHHLRVGDQSASLVNSYLPRLSADATRVAIFQQDTVSVYAVPTVERRPQTPESDPERRGGAK